MTLSLRKSNRKIENQSYAYYRQLEQRKEENKQKWYKKYCELKYKIVYYACTWGIFAAILLWITATIFEQKEIQRASSYYLTTVATLYIGSLMSKDF